MSEPHGLRRLLTGKRLSRRSFLTGALATAAALTGLANTGFQPVQRAKAAEFWGVSKVYFEQTGHHLADEFLDAWQANGGLRTFGYPISEPLEEDGRIVQYFERARFERHPEHAGTQYIVQASLLGNWVTEGRRDEEPYQRLPDDTDYGDDPSRRFFPQTGHVLAYGFKNYWEQNGGLYVFGYPISREFSEFNRDTGQEHTVQYFERARFEWHPEFRGTPYEVLLGRMGAEFADANGIDTSPVEKSSDSIRAFPGLLDPNWSRAVRTPQGDVLGVVTVSSLNVRSSPSIGSSVVGTLYNRHTAVLHGLVAGDEVGDVPAWYKIGENRYIAAAYVAPFIAPSPPKTYSGRWVDVNLSQFYLVAYQDNIPVYGAIITAGRDGRTPIGEFQILRRVRNETMDSATVGIPEDDPDYYFLENVQYTQYFRSGGYAIHENYWSHPSSYGRFSSNGCVGLMEHDARWIWDFLGIGSRVHIHF
jgi:lipoprotein-anchoring transpeptidase ErfK/SrfK